MAKSAQELRIPWPFAPTQVDLNRDTSLLKLIAMVTMLIDHAGKMLFPEYRVMRYIGRLAFPLYAYCIAAGCVYTRDPVRYLRRVVLLALISQPIYAVAMGHEVASMYAVPFSEHPFRAVRDFYIGSWNHPSILVTLAFGILVIWSIRNRELVFTAALLLLISKIQPSLDYGMKGIMLIVLFYLFCMNRWISLPVMAAYMLWWGLNRGAFTLNIGGLSIRYGIQMYAVFALIPIFLHKRSGLKLNKWVGYVYYPAHLILILLLDRFVM